MLYWHEQSSSRENSAPESFHLHLHCTNQHGLERCLNGGIDGDEVGQAFTSVSERALNISIPAGRLESWPPQHHEHLQSILTLTQNQVQGAASADFQD